MKSQTKVWEELLVAPLKRGLYCHKQQQHHPNYVSLRNQCVLYLVIKWINLIGNPANHEVQNANEGCHETTVRQ